MAVKVLIKRKVTRENIQAVYEWIVQLRSSAAKQPGYISGETLMKEGDPGQYLVISTWETPEDWRAWLESAERMKIQKKIDEILGVATEYEVYHHPGRNPATLKGFRGWEGG